VPSKPPADSIPPIEPVPPVAPTVPVIPVQPPLGATPPPPPPPPYRVDPYAAPQVYPQTGQYAATSQYAGQPSPGQPYAGQPYYAQAQFNVLAIVGFVLAFFVSLGAVICGHIALSQIKRTGERGHGLALAAVIIGYAGIGFWVLYFVAVIVFTVIYGAGLDG